MKTGNVFDIQHFSVDDGEGIRTVVFLKGCPLHCIWCHNPEGLIFEPQISLDQKLCTGCARCMAVCPLHCHTFNENRHQFLHGDCALCGRCADMCSAKALRRIGKEMTVNEVIQEVLKDRPFYESSGGGMTLSGGEPLFQPAFALALLQAAREERLTTCVETSGFCSEQVMREIAGLTDSFLFDIKETDAELHQRFTGVPPLLIWRNAELLSELGRSMIFRCPIIPGCNDRESHFVQIAQMANRLSNVSEIQLEPYHPFGLDKYTGIGLDTAYCNSKFLETEKAEEYAGIIRAYTNVPVHVL